MRIVVGFEIDWLPMINAQASYSSLFRAASHRSFFAASFLECCNLAVEILLLVADARAADFHTKDMTQCATDLCNIKSKRTPQTAFRSHSNMVIVSA